MAGSPDVLDTRTMELLVARFLDPRGPQVLPRTHGAKSRTSSTTQETAHEHDRSTGRRHRDSSVGNVEMKLENQVIPVSDVDRTKQFYERLGWRLDDDVAPMEGLRIVQFTPPGSGTSVTFGQGLITWPGWRAVLRSRRMAHGSRASRRPVWRSRRRGPETRTRGGLPSHRRPLHDSVSTHATGTGATSPTGAFTSPLRPPA